MLTLSPCPHSIMPFSKPRLLLQIRLRLAWPCGFFFATCACFSYVLRASDERTGPEAESRSRGFEKGHRNSTEHSEAQTRGIDWPLYLISGESVMGSYCLHTGNSKRSPGSLSQKSPTITVLFFLLTVVKLFHSNEDKYNITFKRPSILVLIGYVHFV